MQGAGLDDGDLLVIDRSLEPQHNKIAVCFIDGEFTVKRLKVGPKRRFSNARKSQIPAHRDYRGKRINHLGDSDLCGKKTVKECL
jgi:SOS-response transcriptional repressor LexA